MMCSIPMKKKYPPLCLTFLDKWFIGSENNVPNYKVTEKASNSKYPVSKGWF